MGISPLYLVFAALCLVIPLAIVAGHRLSAGPIVATAGISLAAFAVYWLVLGGVSAMIFSGPNVVIIELVFFGGILLLVAAWALALSASAAARSWRWVALLTLAGYLSVLAIMLSVRPPDPCLFAPPVGVERTLFLPACSDSDATLRLLVIAAYFAGPVAALAYGLRTRVPRVRMLPGGLTVSPLGAAVAPQPELDAEPDFELDVRRERL